MPELLDELRPRAFAIAYRMLGSVTEAEDVVQEALLRLHGVLEAGEKIEVPEAYLATVVTRLGINRLRSAQMQRETYVGEWLPEPVVTGGLEDPAVHAEMSDSLSLAFLVLLERLSPEQRAVFLLREVFDYGYDTIAEIVGERGRMPAAGGAGPPPHRAGEATLRGITPGARRSGPYVHDGRADRRPRRARGLAGPRRGAAR
jgi:RNA polymerase sigma factor (sigma-70 family)